MIEQTPWEKATDAVYSLYIQDGNVNKRSAQADAIIKRACLDYAAQETTRLAQALATAQRNHVAASELSAAHSEIQRLRDHAAQVKKERDTLRARVEQMREVLERAHTWFKAVRIDGNIRIAGEDVTIRAEIDMVLAAHRKEHGP